MARTSQFPSCLLHGARSSVESQLLPRCMRQAGRERELQPHMSPRCPARSERCTGTAEGNSELYEALRLKKYILKLL